MARGRQIRVMLRGDDTKAGGFLHPFFSEIIRAAVAWLPLEQRTDPARRNLQHRTAGGARAQPRRGAARHASARLPAVRSARACATTKRCCSPRTARSPRAVDEGRSHHARRRMGARQLSRGRRADPRDPRRPAARVLSPAAQARRGSVRRISARVRHRLGLRRAHRQPLRSGIPAALRARLSDRRAAHHRRVVGGGHHAAHRAGREPAARRATHRDQPRRAAGSRRGRGPAARRQRPDASIPNALHDWKRRSRQADAGVRRAAGAAAARPGSRRSPRRWCGSRTNCAPARSRHRTRCVQEEHQRQGASNVTVRNIITSMRLMSDVDWAEFFESVSLVDEALNASGDFAAMDFATRNLYRNAIEELGARLAAVRARDRAGGCCDLAAGAQHAARARSRLLPDRRGPRASSSAPSAFARRCATWPSRIAFTVGAADYVAAIAFTSALLLAVPLALLQQAGVHGGMLWLLGVLGAVPAVDIAVALVNRAVTRGVGASRLPGLALRDGVPERAAHAGGHAGDAELARRGRRAPAPPGDPLPGLARRPAAFRAALRLDGCGHRAHARPTTRCSTSPSSASRG